MGSDHQLSILVKRAKQVAYIEVIEAEELLDKTYC